MQLVGLVGNEQFIVMDDIAFSYYFILFEVSFGQCSIDVVHIILPLKVAILHVAVLTNGRKTAILVVFLYQVGFEKKVPSVDLIAFPLCKYQMAVIVDGNAEAFKQ